MRIRLNGWQRSWCVGAVVLLGVFAFDAYRRMPTADQIRSVARAQAAAVQEGGPGEDEPCHGGPMTQFDQSMCELKAESGATPARAASAAAIIRAAEADIREHLQDRQLDEFGRHVVLWLAIVLGVYGIGWAAARIRRGSGRKSA